VTIFSQHHARAVARILREAAQTEILPRFRGAIAQKIRQKTSSFDLVTDADEAAEAAIAAALQREFPGCMIIGEEASAGDPTLLDRISEADLTFVVDPVDGTKNFSAGMPLFGVMAAAVWRGEIIAGVILDPIRDDWAMALKGEGAWIENSAGRLTNLHVGAPPPVSDMSGIVNWLFFPAPLKQQITANLSRVAAAVDYRCAAHQYRAVAAGHYDFALYGKMTAWDHAPGVLIHKEAGGYAACLDGSPYTVRQRTGGLLCAPTEESWHVLRETLVGDLDEGSEQVRISSSS
jgi:fructose-1,6-bisphosphatase/inositol monophosphatase family enzyme